MFRLVLGVHLACAFGAAAVFWIPLFAAKGGPIHVGAGRLYVRLIYLTALTGAPLALLMLLSATDTSARHTAAFLGYLLTILVMPVHHGVRVVRARRPGARVGSPLHTALAVSAIAAGLALGAAAIAWREWPFLLMSPIGPLLGVRALNSTRLNFPGPTNGGNSTGLNYDWREEHIIFMVMSGIAVHTAMLVFGTTRTLHMTFTGVAAYLPWLLPAVIGLPLLLMRIKQERRGRTATSP
ncbi:MAG: hypothetical protein M3Q55_07945 [Acidobacteriota bacterium]|nr:hypothetical protein [Acidobacteriota bacterium]